MNILVHIDEFHSLLDNYSLSDASKTSLAKTKLVLLVAPTGGGRNTIINQLLKTNRYRYIISDTTREPRVNNGLLEENGREYWFRSEEQMLADIKAGRYLEAEVIHGQQVAGISIRELEQAAADNKVAITDVDIGGINNVLRLKPDTVTILVLPPSFEEWQHRITNRGGMPMDEFHRRLQTAVRIFDAGVNDTRLHLVINDHLQQAADTIDSIVNNGKRDEKLQQESRLLAQTLVMATKAALQP